MKEIIYTIGYAHHTQESFLECLIEYTINCVVDVRTVPYSTFHMQFNRERIKEYLKQHKIAYVHMDHAFGIIKDNPALNTEEGYLDFVKLANTPSFLKGIKRVERGIQRGYKIAFMCAEKDPIDCHRSTLVGRAFDTLGYPVYHILHDGTLEEHKHMEERMQKRYFFNVNQINLFEIEQANTKQLDKAYASCSKDIFIVNAKRVLKEKYDFPKPPLNN